MSKGKIDRLSPAVAKRTHHEFASPHAEQRRLFRGLFATSTIPILVTFYIAIGSGMGWVGGEWERSNFQLLGEICPSGASNSWMLNAEKDNPWLSLDLLLPNIFEVFQPSQKQINAPQGVPTYITTTHTCHYHRIPNVLSVPFKATPPSYSNCNLAF